MRRQHGSYTLQTTSAMKLLMIIHVQTDFIYFMKMLNKWLNVYELICQLLFLMLFDFEVIVIIFSNYMNIIDEMFFINQI